MNTTFSELGTLITREEAKKIRGGVSYATSGSRCVLFCCDDENNCTERGITMPNIDTCNTHDECQQLGHENGWGCPDGYYMAALCKG